MQSISAASTTIAVVASIVAAAIRFPVKFGRCSRPSAKPIQSRKSLFRLSTHPNNQTIWTRKPSLSVSQYVNISPFVPTCHMSRLSSLHCTLCFHVSVVTNSSVVKALSILWRVLPLLRITRTLNPMIEDMPD
ncbi:hypothetical protein DER46DRAFT_617134 [Fusarium sp. MPI-SDFR-AT-0072]|nr:hypothetical protein DER46DRAFT_617134 [Fusarium sp. MPI-SDFR-AT-0072]